MKWIVVLAAVGAAYPAARLLRNRPRWIQILVGVLGVLPFTLNLHDWFALSPISYEDYRGDADGLEVTIVDVVALTLWFCLPKTQARAPYRWQRLAWLGFAALSIVGSELPLFGFFSIWKLLRGYFLLAVVARACESPRLGSALVTGLCIGVVASTVEALYQRYGLHIHQTPAFFLHQNCLGMACNMVMPIALAIMLAGQGGKLAAMTVVGGVVCVILTLSRGSFLMMGAAVMLVFVGSIARRMSLRKIKVGLALGLLGAGLLAYSAKTVIARFESAPDSSTESRELFNRAASNMLSDHPLGIGLNQYSHVLDKRGYADALNMDPVERSGLAHHVYWLTAAETGYLGILSFLIVLITPLGTGLRAIWINRRDIRAEVVLGAVVGLFVTYVHSTSEWSLRTTEISYLLWILVGIVATMSRQVAPRAAR